MVLFRTYRYLVTFMTLGSALSSSSGGSSMGNPMHEKARSIHDSTGVSYVVSELMWRLLCRSYVSFWYSSITIRTGDALYRYLFFWQISLSSLARKISGAKTRAWVYISSRDVHRQIRGTKTAHHSSMQQELQYVYMYISYWDSYLLLLL